MLTHCTQGFPSETLSFIPETNTKKRDRRVQRESLQLLQPGASAAAPRTVLAPSVHIQSGSYSISKGFNLLLQPWTSRAAAALPAAFPTAPLSGAGSEHSPRCWGILQLQLPAQHHPFSPYTTPAFFRKSNPRRHMLASFSHPNPPK